MRNSVKSRNEKSWGFWEIRFNKEKREERWKDNTHSRKKLTSLTLDRTKRVREEVGNNINRFVPGSSVDLFGRRIFPVLTNITK